MEKALENVEHRGVYRLRSRNLDFGVYNERTNSFIGIREKFGSRYLDSETLGGTAWAIEKICDYPDRLGEPWEYGASICRDCGQAVNFDRERGETAEERWQHYEEPKFPHAASSQASTNRVLYNYLDALINWKRWE